MSTQFKDKDNNSYNIEITLGKVKLVKEVMGIDLINLFQEQETLEQVTEPLTLVDLLYWLCEKQIKKVHGEEGADVAFGESLTMDHLEVAGEAFLQALINFIPAKKRERLLRLKAAAEEMMVKEEEKADQELESVLAKMKDGTILEDAKQ